MSSFNNVNMEEDIYFIKKTFQLARKAEGFTSPNPMVGAIIVKDNRLVSQGYHRAWGLPHAEIEAIRKAQGNIKGATLYVNLEPCFHFGKTPPCVEEIIRQKIKKAVIATVDPNPIVKGKSIAKLKRAGVKVKVGLCEDEARALNEVFFKNMKKKKPFVVAKAAQSLDGKIASRKGISKWITSKEAREFSRCLRDKYDAVLVGVNTVVKDNPRLNGAGKVPFKVIIDPYLEIPLNVRILREDPHKVIIFSSLKVKKKCKLSSIKVIFLKEKNGRFSLKGVLDALYRLGIMSVFVEGGSQTLGGFFDEKLIDKVYFFISPKIIGGRDALSSVGARGFVSPAKCASIKNIEIKHLGEDILVMGYPVYKNRG